jgi:hypothetical protein
VEKGRVVLTFFFFFPSLFPFSVTIWPPPDAGP